MEAEDEIPRCRTLLCAVQTGGKYFGKLLKNMCENTVHKTFYNVLDENFYKHDILHLWKNDKCCLCGVSTVHHYAGSLKQRQILSVYSTIDRKCGRIPCKFCPCSFKAKEGVCTSNTDITFSHALLRRVFLKSVHPSLPTFNVRRAVDEIKKIRNTAVHYPETPLHRVDFDKEWLNLKSSLLIICKYLKESTDMLEEEMEKFHYLVNTCKDCSFRIKASLERMKYGELKDSNDNGIVGNPFQMFAVCQECARIQEGCKDAHSLIFDNLHLFMGLTPFEFLPDLEEAEAGCEITFAVNGNFDVEEVNALQQKTKDHTTEQSSGVGKYDLRFSVLGPQKDKIEKILKDFIESEDFSSKLKDMGPEDISVTNGSVIVHLTFKCQEDYDKFSVAVSEGKLFDIVSRMWDEVKCNHKTDKQDAKMIVYIQNVPGRLADSGKTECSAAFFIDTNNDFLTEELCPGTLIKYLKESHLDISEAIRIRKEHPFDRRAQSQELLKFLRNESFEFIQKCLFATQPETIKRKLEESMSSVEVIIQCDHCRKRRICNKELERVTCDACLKQDHAIESRNFQLYTTYSQALPRVPPPTQSQADILAQNTEHAVPGSPIIRGRNEPDAINETRMENKRDTRSAAVTMATKVKEEPTSQKNTVEPDTCTSSRKVRGKRGCIEEAESTPIGKKVKQEKTTPTKAVEAPLRRSPRRSPSPARLPSPARESSPVRQSQDKTKLGTNKLSVNKTRTGKVIVEDSDEEPTTSNKTNTRSTRTMKGKDDCVSKREDDLFESDDLFEVSSSSRKAAPKTKRKKVSESEEDEMPRSKRGRKNIVSLDSEEEKSEDKRQKKDKDSEKSDEEMRKKDKEERGIEDSDNDDMFEVKPASSRRRDAEKRDRSEAADNGVGSNGSQRSPEKRMSREQRSPVRVKREVRDQSHTLSEGTEPGFINTSDPSENVVKKELTNTKEEDQPSNCFVVKFVSLVARQPKPRAENSEETPEGYTRWKGKVVKNFKKFRKSSHAGAGSLPRIIGGSDLEPHIASRSKEIEDWFREEERALSQKSEMERQADELFEFEVRRPVSVKRR